LKLEWLNWVRGKPYLVALAAIVSLALALRLYNLGQPSFWNDESDTALQTLGLIQKGIPQLPSGRVEYEAILSPVFIALAWIVGGQSDFSARVVSTVFGAATIIIVFLVGRVSWGTGAGLLSSLMSTLSTWNLAWSRQARMYAQFQFFYLSASLVALLLLNPGKVTRRRLALIMTLLLVLGGLSSYHSVLLYGSMLVALVAVHWSPKVLRRLNRERLSRRIAVLCLLVGGVVILVLSGVMNLFALGLVHLVAIATGQFFTLIPPNSTLAYHSVFDNFLFQLHPYAILLAFPGVVLLGRRDWRIAAILTALLGVPYLTYSSLFASYTTTLIYLRYVLPELPIIFVLASVTVAWAVGTFARWISGTRTARGHLHLSTVLRVAIPVGLAALVILAPQSGFQPSLANLSTLPEPQPSYKMAANYIKPLMKPGDVVGAIWPENTFYYFGHAEYWIISNQLSITLSGRQDGLYIRFYYTGSLLIKNSTEMYQAMTLHPRGWLLLSMNDQSGISLELWGFIRTNMTFQSAASDPTLQTYFWDTGR
jgi:hypothetical protein